MLFPYTGLTRTMGPMKKEPTQLRFYELPSEMCLSDGGWGKGGEGGKDRDDR